MPSYQVIAVAADTPQDLIKSHEFEASDTLAARQYADDWAATNVPKDSSIMIRVFAGRVFLLERDNAGEWHNAPRPQTS